MTAIVPETTPAVKQLKQMLAGYIEQRIPGLKVYPYEPGHLQEYPCVTMLTRRYHPEQAETGPHDDMTYDFRLRLYVDLGDYEKAQDEIDHLMPILIDVPRHHATMEGEVDFLVFLDAGADPVFSAADGWAAKDLVARMQRTEL